MQHCASFVGFVMAIFWIYSLANEVIGVLTMVGVVSGLSHEVLGLTLLAWSNSLGDLVGNISLARKGHPKIGISAAFGASLTSKYSLTYCILHHFATNFRSTHRFWIAVHNLSA